MLFNVIQEYVMLVSFSYTSFKNTPQMMAFIRILQHNNNGFRKSDLIVELHLLILTLQCFIYLAKYLLFTSFS